MDTTPDTGGTQQAAAAADAKRAMLDRRAMLKGAVAAGAGVAAWSAPSITTLGFTPAYAQVCTVGTRSYFVSSRNTSCNCCSGNDASAKYKEFAANCSGTPFPGTAVLTENDCFGEAIDDNGSTSGNADAGCIPACGGSPGACITPDNPNDWCRVKIEVVSNGACSANVITTLVTTPPQQGQQWHALPEIKRSSIGNCSFFIRIFVECSSDPVCVT